jgi:KaiC/GvpD/RAD55 family RecA-like ATPase
MDNIKMASFSKVDDNLMQIPPELMQFVKRDTYSLLVKGNSGTGKTTLSLTILRALEIRSNFFYISTRLSPRQLFVNYPWLEKFVVRENIEVNDPSNQRSSLSSFEDARLDEPESLFERITNQLMDVKAPIIIIDSWDAIASFMDTEARLNNERVLQTWRERAGAKLIFTSEDSEDNTLDFLVDGIVELKQKVYRNADIRQIFLAKLRGTKINRSSYIFTLNNGVFKSYNHYDPSEFLITNKRINPLSKRDRSEHKTSSPLDLPSNSSNVKKFIRIICESLSIEFSHEVQENKIVLIEVDPVITPNVCTSFLAKIIAQFLSNDSNIIAQPVPGIEPRLFLDFLQPYLSRKLGKNLRLLHYSKNDTEISEFIDEYGTQDTSSERFKRLKEVVSKVQSQRKNKILMSMLMLDDFDNRSDGDFLFSKIIPFLRFNVDLSILVSIKPVRYKELVRNVDMLLRLNLLHNTLLLESIIPDGHSHALSVHRSLGVPAITLDCLV